MKIEKVECDYCGKIINATEITIELRWVFRVDIRQVDRDAPMPYFEPPAVECLYDFCDEQCLARWIEKNPKRPHKVQIP